MPRLLEKSYDDNVLFSAMELKSKSLLKGLPTKQLLAHLDFSNLTGQVTRLVNVDIGNFFIASTPSGISEVLARASSPDGINGSYFSDEYSWYSMSLVSKLQHARISVRYLSCHGGYLKVIARVCNDSLM